MSHVDLARQKLDQPGASPGSVLRHDRSCTSDVGTAIGHDSEIARKYWQPSCLGRDLSSSQELTGLA